jgi:hypothetical protein
LSLPTFLLIRNEFFFYGRATREVFPEETARLLRFEKYVIPLKARRDFFELSTELAATPNSVEYQDREEVALPLGLDDVPDSCDSAKSGEKLSLMRAIAREPDKCHLKIELRFFDEQPLAKYGSLCGRSRAAILCMATSPLLRGGLVFQRPHRAQRAGLAYGEPQLLKEGVVAAGWHTFEPCGEVREQSRPRLRLWQRSARRPGHPAE